MFSTRRTWWAALALTALAGAGCTKETETAPAETPAVNASPGASGTTPAPGPAAPETPPTTPAADKGDTDKGATDAKPADPEIKIESPKIDAPAKGEQPPKDADKAAAADDKLSDAEIAEIKKLPAGDQTLALKQKVCPVSGGHLGDPDMGAPIKVSAEGRTFFLCCKGCKDEVEKNGKSVVAKLDAK